MFLYLTFAILCFYSTLATATNSTDEFAHFRELIRAKHAERVRPKITQIGRQADPCRIEAISGRQGRSGLMNQADKALLQMKHTAANMKSSIRRVDVERKASACKQALMHCKDKNLNREICAEALAHFGARREQGGGSVGRSSGSSWDELYSELTESLTTDEIMDSLNLFNPTSLALLIDNTGSMADDIDQVTRIAENFLKTDLYMDEVIYNFVIMSFGDPDYQQPTSYHEPSHAVNHVNNRIVASMGGDCPEMTCQAIEQMLSYSGLFNEAPIFIFTDASSKDCSDETVDLLLDWAQSYQNTFNFVLTGTCNGEVDGNFTRMAAMTGGMVYRLEDDEIFKLADIVAEATEDSTYISYNDYVYDPYYHDDYYSDHDDYDYYDRKKRDAEDETESASATGLGLMRGKRQGGYITYAFYVDETVGRLTVQVTFEKHADRRLLEAITMTPQSNCNTHNQETGSRFGNIVHYAVHCPCLGEWQIKVPNHSYDNPFAWSAKTFGDFSIDFDLGFEQQTSSGDVEVTKQPCVGKNVKIVITLTQRDSIDDESRIFVVLEGKSNHDMFRLSSEDKEKWYVEIKVPTVPFKVAVRGTTVAGNTFLRIHDTEIKPTMTCLKMEYSGLTVKAGRGATIIMSSEYKMTGEYKLFCFSDRQNEGFETKIERPRDRVHDVVDPDRLYYMYIKVKAPQFAQPGTVVTVTCIVRSINDRASKSHKLMVTDIFGI